MAKEKKSEPSEPTQEEKPKPPKLVDIVVAVSHNEYTKGVKLSVPEDVAKERIASGMFREA